MIPDIEFPQPKARQRYEALMKLMAISDKMTQLGWRVDRARIAKHRESAKERVGIYTEKFLELSGLKREALGVAGAGQTKTVRDWFLVDQKAPVMARDKHTKRPQVNSAALIDYAKQCADKPYGPAAAALYALRKNKKAIEFCLAYDYLSRADGRIHSAFFPYGTKTGRWTSGGKQWLKLDSGKYDTIGCNLQQVPAKEPEFEFEKGRKTKLVESLRNIFIADDGCQVHSYDYEALELRLIAYVSGARKLIDNLDTDVHTMNAKFLFAEVYEDFGPKVCRNAAKSCAYAISYQMRTEKGKYPTLEKTLKESFPDIDAETVQVLADRWFEMYPEIATYQQSNKREIEANGYRQLPISGRRLHYANTMRGQNQGSNYGFQGTGAELINRAIIEIDKHLDWRLGGSYILGQIHDELVLNVREEEWYKIYQAVSRAMEKPAQLGNTFAGIPSAGKAAKCWPK